MDLPNTYTDKNETGCCAVPNVQAWDEQEVHLENKQFIRMYTRSFLFMPLNMGKVMAALNQAASQVNALMPPEQTMILSRDLSPWKAEQMYAVTKPVEGVDNVALNGTFLTKVFEGPYKNAKQWFSALQDLATRKNRTAERVYLFYTTCPKCAKHYGKNYTIGFVQTNS